MTIYVFRDGKLVEKHKNPSPNFCTFFPAPVVSRMQPFESPVTGKEITSWRERDADMKAVNAYDPRDMPKGHVYSRGREAQAKEVGKEVENAWRE